MGFWNCLDFVGVSWRAGLVGSAARSLSSSWSSVKDVNMTPDFSASFLIEAGYREGEEEVNKSVCL